MKNWSTLRTLRKSASVAFIAGFLFVSHFVQGQKNVDFTNCARIEKRSNGNGQSGNCAGVYSNAVADNVVGTRFATVSVDPLTKTGDINFKYIGTVQYPGVITRIWVGTTQLTSVTVGPPSPPTYGAGYTYVKYCFYGQNLPNVGVITFEYTDPQTGMPVMRCSYDGNSGDPVPSPGDLCAPQIATQPTNQTVCGNSVATFNVVANGATNYQWQVSSNNTTFTNISNGGNYSGATSSTLKVSSPSGLNGNYYRCIVSASGCATTVTSSSALLTANAVPTAAFNGSTSFCGTGTTRSLRIDLTGSAPYSLTYSTAVQGGSTSSTTVSNIISSPYYLAVTPSSQTTYTITSVTDRNCTNSSLTGSTTTTVYTPPTATVSNASVCFGATTTSFTINLSSVTGSPNQYSITTGTRLLTSFSAVTNTTLSGTTINVTIPGGASVGVYDFNLVLNNSSASCTSASIPFTLTVNKLPTVTASAVSSTLCTGTSTNLTAAGASTYTWSPSTYLNATTGTTVTATPTVASTTTNYTVTGTDANGCSSTGAVSVTTRAAAGSLTFSPSAVTICNGASTRLSVSGSNSYAWSVSSGTANSLSTTTGSTVIASPTTTTVYSVTGSASNSCPASGSITVTVSNGPTLSFTSGSQTICQGNVATLTASGATSYYWTPVRTLFTNVGATTAYAGTSLATVYAKPSSTTTYTITGVDGSGCTSQSTATVTVTASPFNAASSSASPVYFCNSSDATVVLTAATNSSQIITWGYSTTGASYTTVTAATPVTGADLTPNPTGTSTAVTSSTLTVSNYSTGGSGYAGPEYFRASVTTGSCTFNNDVRIIDIRKQQTNPPLAPVPASASVCSGTGTTLTLGTVSAGTTITWQFSTTSATTGFNPIGGATSTSYATGNLTTTTYYRNIYNRGGCAATSPAATVTVVTTTDNTASLSTPANSCSDGSTTLALNGSAVTGANYQWQVSSDNSSFSDINNATSQNYSSTNYITAGTRYFRRAITGGVCSTSVSNTIIIYPPVQVQTSSDQTICSNVTPAALTSNVAGGTGSYTYQWQSATTFGGTYSNATGTSTTAGYSPAALSASTYYRLVVSSVTSTGTCTATSNETSIVVNSRPTITVDLPTVSLCNGSNVTLKASGAGTGGSYSWSPSTALSSTTQAEVVANPTTGITYTVTGTNSNGCTSTATSVITVNSVPTTATVSSTSVASCTSTINLNSFTTGTLAGGETYAWYTVQSSASESYRVSTPTSVNTSGTYYVYIRNSNCASTTGVAVTAAVLNLSAPTVSASSLTYCSPATADLTALQPNAITGTTYRWFTANNQTGLVANPSAVSSGTYYLNTYSATGNCYSATSSAVTVTINTTPTATVSGNPTAVCSPNTIELSSVNTTSGSNTYQWHTVASNPSPSTLVTEPSRVTSSGTYYLYAISSAGCRSSASTGVTATVNPLPSTTISAPPALCATSSSSISVSSGATSYVWEVQPFNSSSWSTLTNSSPYSGVTTNTLNVSSVSGLSGYKYRATLTNSAGCSATTDFAVFAVEGVLSIAEQPVNFSASNTGAAQFSVIATGSATADYQWQLSTNGGSSYSNITEGTSPYGGVNSSTLTINPAATGMNNYMYRCIVSNGCTTPSLTSNGATLTINASTLPSAPNVIWYKYQTADPMTASGTAGATLKWYSYDGSTYTLLPSAPTPSTAFSGQYQYYVSQVVGGVESVKVPALATIKPVTWFGGTNVSWGTGNNWRGGNVPPDNDSVWIESTPENNPMLDQDRRTGILIFGNNTPIDLNGKKLTVNGAIHGYASFKGSTTSELEITGDADTVIHFVEGHRKLKTLTVNNSGANIKLGTNLEIHDLLKVNSGDFNLNGDTVILKAGTYPEVAMVDAVGGSITHNSGIFQIERSIPPRRANRLMAASVNSIGSIRDNWQEGVNNTSRVYANYLNPNLGYGTHITGSTTGANGFDATQTGNPSMWTYDNNSSSFTAIPNTSTRKLYAGEAYRIIVRGDRSINMNTNNPTPNNTILRSWGRIVTGDTTMTLSSTAGRFNLVGNPYACAVDLAQVEKQNASDIIYIFDPNMQGGSISDSFRNTTWQAFLGYNTGAYVTYDLSLGSGTADGISEVNQYLQPGQAFFIETSNNAPASLTFKETHKFNGTLTQTFKNNSVHAILRANLLPDTTANYPALDGMLIAFDNKYSNDAVTGEDGLKFTNSSENISIAKGSSILSLEKRKYPLVTDSIYLRVTNYSGTKYILQFRAENLSFSGMDAYLLDKYTLQQTVIMPNAETKYPFVVNNAVNASKASDRFVIFFKAAVTLPVDMLQLKAYKKENQVQVEWNTTNEQQVKQHVVERSADAKNFKLLVSVAAKNETVNQYAVTDAAPLNGNNYYRIKTVDVNGSVQYSSVVKVYMGKEKDVQVYPNPVKGHVMNVEMNNLPTGNYSFELFNSLGQRVYNDRIRYQGNAAVSVKLPSTIPPGVYNLKISKSGNQYTIRLLLE